MDNTSDQETGQTDGQERTPGRVLTRVQLIKVLQSKVPLNVYGIPEGVYRPDLLPDEFTIPVGTAAVQGGDHALATLADGLVDPSPQTRVVEQNGSDSSHEDVIRVGDDGEGPLSPGEPQLETGEEATAPYGSHPRVLELAGIIDARQSILERLPEDQPLVEVKAKLDGSNADTDVISAFAGSFASRGESPLDANPRPSAQENASDGTDVPSVDLPEDSEVARISVPSGVPEVVDPKLAEEQHLQRVGVDLMQFRHAFVPIVFAEGFPAFPDGRPIWLRADYEPEDVHRLFEQYLLMGQAGVRQLFLLNEVGPYSVSELQEFFHLYSWTPRLKAYDIFRVAEFRKIQANRQIEIEDDHFLKAQRLFDKAMVYMESEEFIGALTPKVAIDLMKTVVQITRLSSGLPPNATRAEQNSKNGQGHTEIEAIMRTFNLSAPETGSGLQAGGDGSATSILAQREDGSLVHGDILSDPEATHLAQELVIRMSTPRKP